MKKIKLERLDGYSDWNLTKNKLPKDEEYVLCVLETGKQAVMMLVEDEDGICFWSEDFPQDSYSTDQVIFWKPLDRVCGVDTYNTEEFEKLKKRLDQMSSSENPNKWIPVSERLPEDRREVLVTAYWHETYQVMMASYFGDGLWWCVPYNNCGEHMHRLKPKAWMPLPEPYKAESEDKEWVMKIGL